MIRDIEHLFMGLFAICMSSLGNVYSVLVLILPIFNLAFFFFFGSCMTCLHTLDINCFSVTAFANIFSYVVGCLLILSVLCYAI